LRLVRIPSGAEGKMVILAILGYLGSRWENHGCILKLWLMPQGKGRGLGRCVEVLREQILVGPPQKRGMRRRKKEKKEGKDN